MTSEMELVNNFGKELGKDFQKMMSDRNLAIANSMAKSEFLARISHEMRSPLNSIIAMTELLSEADLNCEQKKFLDISKEASRNLLDLVDDLLDLTQLELNEVKINEEALDIYEFLEKIASTMSIKCEEKGLVFDFKIDPSVPQRILCDPKRLKQILTNVLSNAIKFTEQGSVSFTVNRIPSDTGMAQLIFTVKDTGIGISPEKISKVFRRFKQADTSITRRFGGTGLGLAITKDLVNLLNGEIDCRSVLGEGAEFVIKLNFDIKDFPLKIPLKTSAVDLAEANIMVILDNSHEKLLVDQTLKYLKANVYDMEDSDDALDLLDGRLRRNKKVDLIITEASKAESFAEDLRAIDSKIPIILLSNKGRSENVERNLKALEPCLNIFMPLTKVELISFIGKAMGTLIHMKIVEHECLSFQPPNFVETKHILLVEDSLDNQNIVMAYLKDLNVKIDCVTDGQQGFERFKQKKYDLILMDLQMPVMDGHTATQLIRSYEAKGGLRTTPIIVLTAHAFQNDLTKSIEVGCNDFVTKPVAKQKLIYKVASFFTDESFGEDGAYLKERFIKNKLKSYENARSALTNGDTSEAKRFGHTLKGDSRPYGFIELERLGKQLEDLAQNGADVKGIESKLNEIHHALDSHNMTV